MPIDSKLMERQLRGLKEFVERQTGKTLSGRELEAFKDRVMTLEAKKVEEKIAREGKPDTRPKNVNYKFDPRRRDVRVLRPPGRDE